MNKNLILLFLCIFLFLPSKAFAAQEGTENTSINLTADELAYLDRAGEIVIGCANQGSPMLFEDEKTGQLNGISIDIMNMISEVTGLTFRYQMLPSGDITYQDLQRLQVDLLAGVESNEFNRNSLGIAMTDVYLHATKVFVCKKGTEFHPDEEMTIAIVAGSQTLGNVIRQQYPQFKILPCDSMEDTLSALHSGEADAILQNQYTIEWILQKPVYEDLQIVATAAIGDSHCLASLVPIDENRQNLISEDTALLISILNKGIAALNQSQVSFTIIKETAEHAYQFTIWDTMYRFRYTLVCLLISLLLIINLAWRNSILQKKRAEQTAAQKRAQELATINAQMKEQQLLLMDALKRAEEGNRAKSSFLFNMSHDIRTPMNAILGFTEIASRNLTNTEKLADCLEKIQISGKHLLQLINNVLDMSKIENGDVTLAEDNCCLEESIEKVRDTLQAEIDLKHLSLQVDMSAVKNQHVCCDRLRFNQILYNLLSNAVKFSKPCGNILVTMVQSPCAIPEYAAYELRVKDNGIGMSPEFLTHVFEPFEREHTSTISQIRGTGLGMSITKNLVELMGGTIRVTSEPHKGTEFVLEFTFKLREADPQPEQSHSAAKVTTDSFAGKRLLLVDDNELNMEIAHELLCDAGFLVETASDGKIAVDMVRNSTPGYYDAVLMDIQMPVMDGYEASRGIRRLENKELAEIPIIALTANAFDEDKKKSLANGMNAHIAKPLNIAVLFEALENIFKTERS